MGAADRLLLDVQALEDFEDLLVSFTGRQSIDAGGEGQVLERAELLEERRLDRDAVHEAAHGAGLADDIVSEDLDRARVREQQRGDDARQGGLAGSVGADDAVDLAAPGPGR